MRIVLLIASLILTACGSGGANDGNAPTGMTLASDTPRIVSTCGALFLIGTPTPKLVKSSITELKDGPYKISDTCVVNSEDGAISSPYSISRPTCQGWCSSPTQVMTCGTRHFLVNHHTGTGTTESLEIDGDTLVPSNVTSCTGI